MSQPRRPNWPMAVAFLVAAFTFRLAYGLSSPFWFEDERQVYLIGLRSFARGEWPYFGADIVWTGGQVPGAMLGMLIGAPLALWPIPEAPFVLLNLLSCVALTFLAWYLGRRLPAVPRWLIWTTLFTLPWTLNFSAHIVNPSYVLPGAILFFVGFLEGLPSLRRDLVPFGTAWALMGAGLFFVMQMHLSWVLLPPYVLAAAVGVAMGRTPVAGHTRGQTLARAAVGFLAGAAITGSLLVPTIVRHGFGAGDSGGVVAFHPQSPAGLFTITARLLSFASFEMNRFLGLSTADRVLLLWRHLWIAPFALIAIVAGLLQPLWMAVMFFRRARSEMRDWTHVRILLGATVLLVYASFFFSIRGPQAHSFYVMFPVAALFAFSCWQAAAPASDSRRRRWERVAAAVLVSGAVTHAGVAIDRWPRQSLYVDRTLVADAIAQKNDRYLGDRRDTWREPQDHRPRTRDDVGDEQGYLSARPVDDLQVVTAEWTPVAGRISAFALAVTNRSRVAAWLDIRCATAYTGGDGRLLAAREVVIKQILQPGETRGWRDVADGRVPPGAVTATIVVTGAEKCIPSSGKRASRGSSIK